jgi:hypothetical protein
MAVKTDETTLGGHLHLSNTCLVEAPLHVRHRTDILIQHQTKVSIAKQVDGDWTSPLRTGRTGTEGYHDEFAFIRGWSRSNCEKRRRTSDALGSKLDRDNPVTCTATRIEKSTPSSSARILLLVAASTP